MVCDHLQLLLKGRNQPLENLLDIDGYKEPLFPSAFYHQNSNSAKVVNQSLKYLL